MSATAPETPVRQPRASAKPQAGETATLAAWLAARTDAQLVTLLHVRPDLAVPLPSSMTVLAARAQQRASVLRATDDLDTLEFAVVELLVAHSVRRPAGDATPPHRKTIQAAVKGRATKAALDAALDRLSTRALVWFDGDAVHLVPATAEALPWPLGSTTELPDALTETEVDAALSEISPAERALLDKLAATGPRGRSKDAAPTAPPDRPIQRLLARRLLHLIDEETVELPVTVGQILRDEPVTHPHALTPPKPPQRKYAAAEVNAVAAGEVGELLRHSDGVLESLGAVPAPALRAGGLGVRELRRVAKQIGVEEQRAGLLVELLAAAKLVEKGSPDLDADSDDEFWAPTPASDAWQAAPPARRWLVLARAWLELDRMPWMIGMRDPNDKPLAALAIELRNPHAVRDRRAILDLLAEYPTGTALDAGDVAKLLAWRQPRRRRHFRAEAVGHVLREAGELGLIGRGALASPARALLHDGPTSAADAETAMAAALPEPVDHVLVQADLTVIAPGPLVPELQQRIALVADVESAGAATVYRVGETSVRRALDAGLTAAELHALFTTHSRTPVPQALTYLIDDVARRHGQLRAGVAQSFVRSDDPALLAQVLAAPVAGDLALRAIAPTVAIALAPLGEVLDALRGAGFAPAGEDSSGVIVDLRPHGARIAARPLARQPYRPTPPSTEQLESLVAELRAGDRAAAARSGRSVRTDGTRTSTAATLALLQLAARARRQVNIGYVDAQGVASQRVVEPLEVGNGQLDARDPVTGAVRHFTLHRIASVALLE
ncbi:helicase-associated domain-containing protein [Nocardia sp. NEAU-351]|uniref:Helicase-associated domain-containing protein n=2 Tax=Nocardia bovistercoris TaxID=2785916 RepID=A0A931IFH3_9NOCA|nr:helicase-associated domain-containing protein [Nocardia bovistercoris]